MTFVIMMLGLGPFFDMRFVLSIYDIKCLVSVLVEIHFYTHAHTNSTSTQISIIFIEYSFSSLSQGGVKLSLKWEKLLIRRAAGSYSPTVFKF